MVLTLYLLVHGPSIRGPCVRSMRARTACALEDLRVALSRPAAVARTPASSGPSARVGALGAHDPEQLPAPGQALEFVTPRILQGDAGTFQQLGGRRGHQDLARSRQ